MSSKPTATRENTKRICSFCADKSGKIPTYTDVAGLKKFLNDRGKIVPAARSGNCAKHQRKVTMGIKHARHLALMAFSVKPY